MNISKFLARYLIIFILGLNSLWVFYKILTPLTTYLVASILSLFSTTFIIEKGIYYNGLIISLIPACIAGSAYYLLTILNLSTPNIKLRKRLTILITSLAVFFVLNSLRIVLLANLYADSFHLFSWYFLSTLFVILIWIFSVKYYKISAVPFYTDVKYLINQIKNSQRNKQNKKPRKNRSKSNRNKTS